MANVRLTMRKIREVLRLHFECDRNQREIADAVGASTTTVWHYLRRTRLAGLSWPLPPELLTDDAALEARLYPPPARREPTRGMPDWPAVHREIGRKGVTLDLLWQEYKAQHPDGCGYSWFCKAYQEWAQRLPVTMRQTHMPGQKLFVAALGVSGFTFAELTWTQQLPDWIGSHVRAFAFYDGLVEILVPDNLKSGVHKPGFYDPDINPTYQEMARHYSVAVIPARSKKPRDKPKAELSVLLVQRWVLARLRNQRFFSLGEANRAVAALLGDLNNRPFKKLPGSRRSVFDEIDRPALRPLPEQPYQYAEWKVARIGPDYHVELDQHYYSVPYRYAREQVDVRHTTNTVEIFHRGQRIAAHGKSARRRYHTTIDAHMPPEHLAVAKGWDPERLRNWAADIGPHTAAVIQHLLGARKHPQQSYRTCLGVLRMGKDYGRDRLEAACRRAIDLKAPNYKFIDSTLKNGLDREPEPATGQADLPLVHANVRGPSYYH
jgi:transposase